ncbi:hypothetical protein [Methanosarcina horonobensis]|uniref:hypothetical protein n=1 Tax=Methanosarcina horonobensis TaxID=418008 RepID=UPI000A6EAB56|nr:hypothetical protein [Methanosarcina horonobensis]
MKKLSDDLQELVDHVADVEKKVAAAEQASKEKVEVSIQKSKADAKARQESFKADVKKRQEATAMNWQELQEDFIRGFSKSRTKLKPKKRLWKQNKQQDGRMMRRHMPWLPSILP